VNFTTIHFPFLQVIGVFFRFMLHLQSSSSPLYGNLYALIIFSIPNLYLLALLYQRLIGPHPAFSRCFIVPRLICPSVRCLLPTISSNLQSACASCLPIPHSFLLVYDVTVYLSCAFTLEKRLETESRGRYDRLKKND